MASQIADRAQGLRQSDIRRFSAICAAMKGINLSQGVCDQPAPDAVKQGAKDAIDADHAVYTNLKGIVELREAIARKMKAFNGIVADPEREIAVNVNWNMLKLTIDGKEVTAPKGTTIIQAAASAGITIPNYCWHPGLSIAGNCRICLVDVEKAPKPQIACHVHCQDGMGILGRGAPNLELI